MGRGAVEVVGDISAVNRAEDDVDGIRSFGDHITISHNWAHDVWANPDDGGHPHVDCMQTFAQPRTRQLPVVSTGGSN